MLNDSLPEILRKRYDHMTNAEALFFKNVYGDPSFRFEVPGLLFEFSDGFYVGPDPKGTFYYNDDFLDLSQDQPTQARYYVDQWSEEGELYAYIQFFKPDSSSTLFAEFLGRDEYNVTGSSGLLQIPNKYGEWKKSDYVVSGGTATKSRDSTRVTVTCRPQHKAASFDCSTSDQLYGDAFKTNGQLTIRDIDSLDKATWLRWYHDYAVFHEGRDAKDFCAFFFPVEGPAKDPLGTQKEGIYRDAVTWTRI